MGSGLWCGPASGGQCRDFNHMNRAMQRQGNDGAGPDIGMGARDRLTIHADMTLFNDFLGKAAGFGQPGEE
jgi:hypothetical protein